MARNTIIPARNKFLRRWYTRNCLQDRPLRVFHFQVSAIFGQHQDKNGGKKGKGWPLRRNQPKPFRYTENEYIFGKGSDYFLNCNIQVYPTKAKGVLEVVDIHNVNRFNRHS